MRLVMSPALTGAPYAKYYICSSQNTAGNRLPSGRAPFTFPEQPQKDGGYAQDTETEFE